MSGPASAPLHVVRPARESDLGGLLELVRTLADSLTSLPANRAFLEHRVHDSLRAFDPRVRAAGAENYLFVLERIDGGARLVGCSGLVARVGGFDPFYTYALRRERLVHLPLGVDRELEVLHLHANHKGPSELCSLLLHPAERGGGVGRLLSLARFHFMAAYPARFSETVLAELRGHIDAAGKSPFWEAVGRAFFAREFYEADGLSGLGEKDFIRDLMPRHPIYVDLLPEDARGCIGRVHRETAPALALLASEGLRSSGEVDIFDAGPILSAPVREVRTVREASRSRLKVGDATGGDLRLLSNGTLDFRCVCVPALSGDDGALVTSAEAAAALGLCPGDEVVHSCARPAGRSETRGGR